MVTDETFLQFTGGISNTCLNNISSIGNTIDENNELPIIRSSSYYTLQYRKQGYSKTSACPKLFSKGSHAFSSVFSLSAASKIITLAPCALSHHFQDLYNSLSSTVIYTISISKFNANSSKKFPIATLNQ